MHHSFSELNAAAERNARISTVDSSSPKLTLRESPWQGYGRQLSVENSGMIVFTPRVLAQSIASDWTWSGNEIASKSADDMSMPTTYPERSAPEPGALRG
jgi:hypothetical protein